MPAGPHVLILQCNILSFVSIYYSYHHHHHHHHHHYHQPTERTILSMKSYLIFPL